jgi:excinuclease UvrABC nuclease subunit
MASDISRELADMEEISLEDYPRFSGVYFLMRAGDVVYVGKSRDIICRAMQHRNERTGQSWQLRKDFDSFRFMRVDEEILDEIEQRSIAYFQPRYNSDQSKLLCQKRYPNLKAVAGLADDRQGTD